MHNLLSPSQKHDLDNTTVISNSQATGLSLRDVEAAQLVGGAGLTLGKRDPRTPTPWCRDAMLPGRPRAVRAAAVERREPGLLRGAGSAPNGGKPCPCWLCRGDCPAGDRLRSGGRKDESTLKINTHGSSAGEFGNERSIQKVNSEFLNLEA